MLKVFDPTKGVKAAAGGMVKADQWAMVGEEGPELVKFGSAANVISNDLAKAAFSAAMAGRGPNVAGGPSSQNIIVNAPAVNNAVANTKVETAVGITDPFTQAARAY